MLEVRHLPTGLRLISATERPWVTRRLGLVALVVAVAMFEVFGVSDAVQCDGPECVVAWRVLGRFDVNVSTFPAADIGRVVVLFHSRIKHQSTWDVTLSRKSGGRVELGDFWHGESARAELEDFAGRLAGRFNVPCDGCIARAPSSSGPWREEVHHLGFWLVIPGVSLLLGLIMLAGSRTVRAEVRQDAGQVTVRSGRWVMGLPQRVLGGRITVELEPFRPALVRQLSRVDRRFADFGKQLGLQRVVAVVGTRRVCLTDWLRSPEVDSALEVAAEAVNSSARRHAGSSG